MAAGRGRWSGGAPGPPRLPGQPRSCGTDPGACWLLLRSHRPTAGGAATPAPSPGRFLPSLRVAPPRRAAPARVLRAHYTHRVTGPHRLPHGARHPRGALSASSSRHGSHLRGWRAPSPRDVPLRPQDQRAARVSREGGDARPAAAPLGPGSGAQRPRASPLCPNKGGRHRGTRTPTRRAGPCSEGSRRAIESFTGAYQVPKQRRFKRTDPPLLPHAALAHRPGTGTQAPRAGGVASRGQAGISHRAGPRPGPTNRVLRRLQTERRRDGDVHSRVFLPQRCPGRWSQVTRGGAARAVRTPERAPPSPPTHTLVSARLLQPRGGRQP